MRQWDYLFVLYQFSAVPEAKWQEIVSKEQYEFIGRLRRTGAQYKQHLIQNKLLEPDPPQPKPEQPKPERPKPEQPAGEKP